MSGATDDRGIAMNRRELLGLAAIVPAVYVAGKIKTAWSDIEYYRGIEIQYSTEGQKVLAEMTVADQEYKLGFMGDHHYDRRLKSLRFAMKRTVDNILGYPSSASNADYGKDAMHL
jgi:membrane-anchored protein YejM (alkaline phosphatase superfamily)